MQDFYRPDAHPVTQPTNSVKALIVVMLIITVITGAVFWIVFHVYSLSIWRLDALPDAQPASPNYRWHDNSEQ